MIACMRAVVSLLLLAHVAPLAAREDVAPLANRKDNENSTLAGRRLSRMRFTSWLARKRRRLTLGSPCTTTGRKCGTGLVCGLPCGVGRRLFGAPAAELPTCTCENAPSPPPSPTPPAASPPSSPPPAAPPPVRDWRIEGTGTASVVYTGPGGRWSSTSAPRSIAIAPDGLLAYVGDAWRVRSMELTSGTFAMSEFLGGTSAGSSDGIGTSATFSTRIYWRTRRRGATMDHNCCSTVHSQRHLCVFRVRAQYASLPTAPR